MADDGGAGLTGREALARSAAFREGALRTEVRRAYAVIGVVGLVTVLVLGIAQPRNLDWRLRAAGVAGVVLLLILQGAVLALARWARRRGRMIPAWFIAATVVIESLIPTALMASNIRSGAMPPYAALSGPPMLVYGLMITLMTLRLRPWTCILAGAVSAAGYGGILAHITYKIGVVEPTTGLPRTAYVDAVVLILISGIAAAWVSREIRRHAEAALGEAETRRRMGQIERDMEAARSIQQALLPGSTPDIPGFEIAGWNRPADLTGGDYYDWRALPDGNWIITLADVSGHGIGPAMVTAACRAYVRASSLHDGDLGSLTSRINRLLAEDLPDGRFITMVSVLIERGTGTLALLSAGHGPIVLYVRRKRDVEDIVPRDLPLAVVADQTFGPAQPITMHPGDVLALVTDGFVEWSRHDASGKREEFGLARLKGALARHAALAPAELIAAITGEVTAFAGEERQQDDLTMVVIRRK